MKSIVLKHKLQHRLQSSKQQLVVAEWYGKVTMFDKDGKKAQIITHEKFPHPIGVAVDKDDNVYVSDKGSYSLFKFSMKGQLMKENSWTKRHTIRRVS